MEFFTSNQSMLKILYAYLEAKQDLNSICTAIDLYLTNHNYAQAIQLYEKYSRVRFLFVLGENMLQEV
jgi:hypothetical protein